MKPNKFLTILFAVFTISLVACGQSADDSGTHKVKFDTGGGSSIPTQIVEDGELIIKPDDPIREGYTFINWTYNGQEWLFDFDVVTKNITLKAEWEANEYLLTLGCSRRGTVTCLGCHYGEVTTSNNSYYCSTYHCFYDSTLTIIATPNSGFSFLRWQTSNGEFYSSNSNCTFKMGSTPLSFEAIWNDGNEYTVTLIPSVSSTGNKVTVQYNHQYSFPVPTRNGYYCAYWVDDNGNEYSNEGTWKTASNVTLRPHWEIANYTITYDLGKGTNDSSNPSTYTMFDDTIVLNNPSREGYVFGGWFLNGVQITSIPSGSTGDITLEARWVCDFTVTSSDTDRGSVSVYRNGQGYSGENITVTATPKGNYAFAGWYCGAVLVNRDLEYTFKMPPQDYSIVARFSTQEEMDELNESMRLGATPILSDDGKTIYYGLYPQYHIIDSELISDLNSLTSPEPNGWYLYNNEYYVSATSASRFDDLVYWFKCEHIPWNVLNYEIKDNTFLVLSREVLDAQKYKNCDNGDYPIEINGESIYMNNYKYSDIRAWLNKDFLNEAFAFGNEYIKTVTIDNSAESAGFNNLDAKTVCEDTEDKVFLLSYKDYMNPNYGFAPNGRYSKTRSCKATEWARITTELECTTFTVSEENWKDCCPCYWTRSPFSDNIRSVCDITYSGEFGQSYANWYNPLGVRPAIVIGL